MADETVISTNVPHDTATNESQKSVLNPLPAQTKPTLIDLMQSVLDDPKLRARQKKSLIDELRKNNPGSSDRWTYRYAILILGGAVLLSICAIWTLAPFPGGIPDGLVSIGSAAVGGLAGLLAPGRGGES